MTKQRYPVTAAGTFSIMELTPTQRQQLNGEVADLMRRQLVERELVESLGMTWAEWRSLRAVFA